MPKSKLVVQLDAITNGDEGAVGAKAFSLVRMNRIGLSVPAGFCVTAAAYREHIRNNDITPKIMAALAKLKNAKPPGKQAILSRIRQVIIGPTISDALRQEIESHYKARRAERVAVRSSATAEDLPGHSFAGLYETYLGVAELESCLEAIKKCWASLWTERAYEYRQKNGFDHLKVNMAVIVQTLIPADASGVMFTADPATGRKDQIVIESCLGLADTLVSGKVTPDRFVINKKNLKLISQKISEKKIRSVPDEQGSVEEQTVTAERAATASITKAIARKLAKLARRVEAEFGCPQDIEWALRARKIYLLQSRPITTLPPPRSWQDRQVWCSLPAKEVIPDVVTPVTLSILQTMVEDFFDPIFHMLCTDRGHHPVFDLVAGRVYFNVNIWVSVIRSLPGVRNYDFRKLAGSHKGLLEISERLQTAANEDLPNIKFNRLRFFLKMPLIIIGTLSNTPEKGQSILEKIRAKNEKWSRLDVTSLTSEQIIEYCQDIVVDFRELLGHVLYLFGILTAFPILHIACTRWLSDDGCRAGKLLAGLGQMDDAVAGLNLWRLAGAANTRPEVKRLILSNDHWHTIQSKLYETDSGKEFLRSWSEFMDRHGHHCLAELELYNPRWSQTPDYILKLVRGYICQIGKIDPIQNYNKLRQERRQLEQQCRKKLKNPIKRIIFNHLLVRSQQGSIFRENVKSEVIKLLTAMRKMLLELGKRLRDKGVLKNQDDVFFLRLEEIEPVVQGKADFDIHQAIATRRAEYNKNRSITPPDVVFGRFDPDNFVPEVVDKECEVLNGLAVSPGVATGKARVILRTDTREQVSAGEILVAPFTDPGWTPYFVPAAAIVMDQGGILSHGSILAREYGIPAVVNVGPATKIIKTGQTIQVDGNRGVVRILP